MKKFWVGWSGNILLIFLYENVSLLMSLPIFSRTVGIYIQQHRLRKSIWVLRDLVKYLGPVR